MSPRRRAGAARAGFVRRLSDRPVVEPGAVPGYGPIFNAGVIAAGGVYHLFARGVREGYSRNPEPGPRFLDYVSDVLVFTSRDGVRYRFQQVLASGGRDGAHSLEDPRVQRVRSGGAEHVVMTYTHLPDPASGGPWRIGLRTLAYSAGRFSVNGGPGGVVSPPGVADKDAVVFNVRDGRVALVHRIHPDMQLALFDTVDELVEPTDGFWQAHLSELERHVLIRPSKGALGVGAGAPPVSTEDGLLLFYHERDGSSRYTIRAALLDEETGAVRALLEEPILEPELPWERRGDVDDVVFVQGAVARSDGTIYLTYGAADRCVGAALVDTADLLRALRAAA